MCETLDEIHEAQLAAILAKMRKEAKKEEKPPARSSVIPLTIFYQFTPVV